MLCSPSFRSSSGRSRCPRGLHAETGYPESETTCAKRMSRRDCAPLGWSMGQGVYALEWHNAIRYLKSSRRLAVTSPLSVITPRLSRGCLYSKSISMLPGVTELAQSYTFFSGLVLVPDSEIGSAARSENFVDSLTGIGSPEHWLRTTHSHFSSL